MYLNLLQAIICDRFFNRDEALQAIDEAFESGTISQLEARKLEARLG